MAEPTWTWTTSTYSSGGNCVEVGFHKSSHSLGNGTCVEVGLDTSTVHVRDTKDRDGATLGFTPTAWADFITRIKNGQFNL